MIRQVGYSFRASRWFAPALGLALIAGCSTPPPPPPAPPPPVAVAIPRRPTPPDNASPNIVVPPLGADGLRVSINRGISPAQTLWNLRSAWNVAALDCPVPQFTSVADDYRTFITANRRQLHNAQRQIDAEFRTKYGSSFAGTRDTYLTSVYNHFALPPTLPYFCAAAAAMGRDAAAVKPAGVEAWAGSEMPSLEIVFDEFYQQYDKYRADAAAWDAKYAPSPIAPAVSGVVVPAATGPAQ